MEQMTFSTPAILFSTVSLLLLAFTNRFMAISSLARDLHTEFNTGNRKEVFHQIKNLRKRISLTKAVQLFAIGSLLFSSLSMFSIFFEMQLFAKISFGLGLLTQFIALCISGWEIWISTNAIKLELSDMELDNV